MWLIDITFDVLLWLIARIGAIIHSLVSLFFWLASMLLELAFALEKFTTAGVVRMGWGLTRDLVNLFFVLVLLVIAFATILRIESYGAKQLLRNLIIVALLINFSLVICGAIIDSSQLVTRFFYDEVRGANGVAARIASVLNIQKETEINPDASASEKIAEGLGGVLMMIFSIFMGIILILAAALAVGIGAFFLISRMIALWILIILAPIGWFCSILPGTKQYAKQWWNSFLKWTFFAPVYAFFIWLAVKIGEAGAFTGIINQEMENIVASQGFIKTTFSVLLSVPTLFLQFFVILGFLYAGLVVAQKTGAYGAAGAVKLAGAAGKGAAGWTGKQAWTRYGAPLTKTAEEKLTKVGTEWQTKGGVKGLVGRGLGQIARAPRAITEMERKAMAGSEAKYKSWTDDHLKSAYARAASPRDKAAIAKILGGRGEFAADAKLGFTEEHIKDATKLAKRYEAHSDIIKARPDLAPSIDKDIEETVSKLKPAHMEKLQTEALIKTDPKTGKKEINKDVIDAVKNQLLKKAKIDAEGKANNQGKWKSNHLSKLAEANPEVLNIIMDEINNEIKTKSDWDTLEKERPDIANYLKSNPGKSVCGELDILSEKSPKESMISSPTESEFQKAKEQGYKGK